MDIQKYNQIYQYLTQQIIPTTLTNTQQINRFKNFCENFIIKNNFIYKRDRRQQNNLLKVSKKFELEPILFMMHNDPTAGHFSVDIMFNKIRDRYYWPQMYEDIHSYVQSCDSCQRRGKNKKNQLLHPIPVHSPFYQIGIDFVGPYQSRPMEINILLLLWII